MSVTVFAFYLFAVSALAGGLFTVISRNPVHSVLWLILSFLSSAGLFVLLGAEFVAMLLIIVYVGAVAVLFLFVVMMLDVDFSELRAGDGKISALGAFDWCGFVDCNSQWLSGFGYSAIRHCLRVRRCRLRQRIILRHWGC